MPLWKNYGENQRVRPLRVVHLRDLAEMQQCVKQASEQGRRIKCVGSAHSFSGVLLADKGELLVDLGGENESLKGITLLDSSLLLTGHENKKFVAVQTSVVVAELANWLDKRGLGLSTFGAVNGQTMVGAMATGTHGSDLEAGPLSNMTRAFILVDGQGEVRLVQPSSPLVKGRDDLVTVPANLPDESEWFVSAVKQATPTFDDDLFSTCLIGVGTVGIIYAVVLEVEQQFWLHEKKSVVTWNELKRQWTMPDAWREARETWRAARQQLSGEDLKTAREQWRLVQQSTLRELVQRLGRVVGDSESETQAYRTFEFTINPYATADDGDHRCNVVRRIPTEPDADALPCPADIDLFAGIREEVRERLGFRWKSFRGIYICLNRFWRMVGLDEWFTSVLVRLFGLIPHRLGEIFDRVLIDPVHPRTGPSHQILTREVYEVVGWGIEAAVNLDRLPEALDDVLAKYAELYKQRRFTTGGVAIRFVAMTDAFLGVSHDEVKVMIEPTMLHETPHGGRILSTLERLVIDNHDGVIHFGLEWDEANDNDTRLGFLHFERFRAALQETLDPAGLFSNGYTRRVGIYDRTDSPRSTT